MINANELRLGNKILKLSGYVVEVDIDTLIRIKRSPQFYKPIPLTPEVLEKCGCTMGTDPDMWRHASGVWLTRAANGKFFTSGFRADHYIEYLHQYQNTVFWATGEDLKVEL